ncbi:MAG: hypothetical protein Cons2KO_24350 [Congregibacter sp.]
MRLTRSVEAPKNAIIRGLFPPLAQDVSSALTKVVVRGYRQGNKGPGGRPEQTKSVDNIGGTARGFTAFGSAPKGSPAKPNAVL